jgi:hypothetical protein
MAKTSNEVMANPSRESTFGAFPSMGSDRVYSAIHNQSRYVSLHSLEIALSKGYGVASLTPPPQKLTLTQQDFYNFARLVSETVLRQDGGTSSDPDLTKRLIDYYTTYNGGKFVSYFGTKYDKLQISRTIGDTEINQTVSVFLEFPFDAADLPKFFGPRLA